jgi:hypothetical protein
MATKTRSSVRNERSVTGSRAEATRGANGGMRGAMRDLKNGIHVTAEMPDPKVARITIDIEWQHLVSRVARTVRQQIKKRGGRSTASPRRTASTRRSP